MLKNLLYYVLILLSFSVNSQTFQWLNTLPITFTSNYENISYTVTSDPTGNIYMMGYKDTPYPYGEILGTQFYNKYNSIGTLLFSNEIVGHATVYSADTDSMGNVILIVGYVGSISVGTLTINSINSGLNFSVIKLDSLGTPLWTRQFTLAEAQVKSASSAAIDSSDNIYVGYDNYNSSYIEKITPAGILDFTITQANVKTITSLSVDSAGNIYAAGTCAKPAATFAGTAIAPPVNEQYNVYVAKYSATAITQWVKYVEDITCSTAQVKVRNAEAVYLTAELNGAFSFDTIVAEGPGPTSSDVFITKLNSSGDFQWVREVPGAGVLAHGKRNTFDVDALNNVYFGGRTSGTINWSSAITTTPAGNQDAIVLKYDSDGTILMAKLAGGSNYDRVDGLNVSIDGSINICGLVKSTGSFDTITYSAVGNNSLPYLVKLSNTILNTTSQKEVKISLYPNPAADFLHFSNLTNSIDGTLFNTIGQQLKSFHLNPSESLSISDLAAGTYFIKIKDFETLKFIKL